MERRRLKPGALTAPLPPALVTVGDMENHNVLTVAWTGILATVPPKTYVSIRPSRYSYGILKEHGEFVVNLVSEDMAREVDFAGIYTGAKVNKFERCGFTPVESECVKAPTIAESQLALECRVCEVIPMGSHDVFVADIVSVSCREELMDESGRLCLERARLLAYAHGEYYSLGERLGKFGFSTDKAAKAIKVEKAAKAAKDSVKPKNISVKAAKDSVKPKDKSWQTAGGAEILDGGRDGKKKPFYYAVARPKARTVGKNKDKCKRRSGK